MGSVLAESEKEKLTVGDVRTALDLVADEEELSNIDDQLDAFLKARFDGNHITK